MMNSSTTFIALMATSEPGSTANVFSIVNSASPAPLGERELQLIATASELLREAVALREASPSSISTTSLVRAQPENGETHHRVHIRYLEADDSILVDGEYLIKGVAARILWLVLTLHETEGRTSFLNRELRAHPFLKLSSLKDNLEARLLNLQRRLEQRNLPFRLERDARGRARLAGEVCVRLEMEKNAA